MGLLDELIQRIEGLDEDDQQQLAEMALSQTANKRWIPVPGPQTNAYFSDADELFYGGSAGGGKGFLSSEKILTPIGWKTIGDLKPGDIINSTDGGIQIVTHCFRRGLQPIYRISFSDGTQTDCDSDHIWLAWEAGTGEYNKKKYITKDIFHHYQNAKRRLGIPIIEKEATLFHKQRSLPVPPYVLGALIGDGTLSKDGVRIATPDREVIQKIEGLIDCELYKRSYKSRCDDYRIPSEKIIDAINSLGLLGKKAHEKFIPESYLFSKVSDRYALLHGLMDTDGWAEKDGDCYYSTSSEILCADAAHLARSLGAFVTIRTKIPKFTYKGQKKEGKKTYTLRIKMRNQSSIFTLPRKKQMAENKKHQSFCKWITSIEHIGEKETICIKVSHKNSLFIIDNFTVTHNTDLLCGLALEEHTRTLILRRFREDVKDINQRLEDILGTTDGRNNADLIWKVGDQTIRMAGCKQESDKERFKGKPYDLYGFDEICDFTRSQFEFIKTWNRSAKPGQRCRVLCTGNPPTTPEGLWVIEYWAPWLDPKHPNPAAEGELRWFTTDKNGKEIEVDGPGPHIITHADGTVESVRARSRTFIRARLEDNPYLANTNYGATLDALPYEIRKAYRDGIFDDQLEDDPTQVIPTQWVLEAQYRWEEDPPKNVPMCAIGIDIAFGGADELVIAPRHDGWYAPFKKVPGKEIKHTSDIMAAVVSVRKDNALLIPDMGGGYGLSFKELAESNNMPLEPYKGSTESRYIDKSETFQFDNFRAESYWKFREALDPEQPGGSSIALPPSKRVVADLTAPKFSVSRAKSGLMKITITPKDEVKQILGRSPDEGDAVIMAYTAGAKADTHASNWLRGAQRPQVNMGHKNKRRR